MVIERIEMLFMQILEVISKLIKSSNDNQVFTSKIQKKIWELYLAKYYFKIHT